MLAALAMRATDSPADPAIEDEAGCWSWAELYTTGCAVGAGLRRARGARTCVAAAMGRCREWYALYIGCAHAGMLFVGLSADDLPVWAEQASRQDRELLALDPLLVDWERRERGGWTFRELVDLGAAEVLAPAVAHPPSTPLSWVYSSASEHQTGRRVMVTQGMANHEVRGYPKVVPQLSRTDRVLQHHSALWQYNPVGVFHLALSAGACLVVTACPLSHVDGSASGAQMRQLVSDKAATVVGVNAHELAELSRCMPPSLRLAVVWGESLPPHVLTCCRAAGMVLVELFGSVTSWLCLYRQLLPYGVAGFEPAPGVEVRVVSESGEDCAPEELGELQVAGAGVPTVGHQQTGDLVKRDKHGRLHFCGRAGLAKLDHRWVDLKQLEAALAQRLPRTEVVALCNGSQRCCYFAAPLAADCVEIYGVRGVCVLPRLPRKPSGKVDYRYLLSLGHPGNGNSLFSIPSEDWWPQLVPGLMEQLPNNDLWQPGASSRLLASARAMTGASELRGCVLAAGLGLVARDPGDKSVALLLRGHALAKLCLFERASADLEHAGGCAELAYIRSRSEVVQRWRDEHGSCLSHRLDLSPFTDRSILAFHMDGSSVFGDSAAGLHANLLRELAESRMVFRQRGEEDGWKGSTCWGDHLWASSGTVRHIVRQLCKTFRLRLVDCWINLYDMDGDCGDMVPAHHDQWHQRTPRPDFTAGVSFGAKRQMIFSHPAARVVCEQSSGDVFAFNAHANYLFTHGLPAGPSKAPGETGRISVIVWGCCDDAASWDGCVERHFETKDLPKQWATRVEWGEQKA